MPECRHCGKPIKFVNIGGRWRPTDPATGEAHRCEIDVKCESCGVTFKGAPWMKECSLCYRGELRKGRAWRGQKADGERARQAEPVSGDHDEDNPF